MLSSTRCEEQQKLQRAYEGGQRMVITFTNSLPHLKSPEHASSPEVRRVERPLLTAEFWRNSTLTLTHRRNGYVPEPSVEPLHRLNEFFKVFQYILKIELLLLLYSSSTGKKHSAYRETTAGLTVGSLSPTEIPYFLSLFN